MEAINETIGTPQDFGSIVQPSGSEVASQESSWYQSIVPSRQTLGLFGIIAAGLTLIGATTYIVATRFVSKKGK